MRKLPNHHLLISSWIVKKALAVLVKESSYESMMMYAAMCTEVFGFLRSGEYFVMSKNSYELTKHLSFSDISVDSHTAPTLPRLHLRYSKTDHFGKGAAITLARSDSTICPVTTLVNYLTIRGPSEGALLEPR